jgi:Beta xylosidase C-terminal Concanavalin A-like domain
MPNPSKLRTTSALRIKGRVVAALNLYGDSSLLKVPNYSLKTYLNKIQDNFTSLVLDSAWSPLRAFNYSLSTTLGSLRINAAEGELKTGGGGGGLTRQISSTAWQVTTKVTGTNPGNGTYPRLGILCYQDDNNYLACSLQQTPEGVQYVQFDAYSSGTFIAMGEYYPGFTGANGVWLKLVRSGQLFKGYYSLDGSSFLPIQSSLFNTSAPEIVMGAGFTGTQVGILAQGYISGGPAITADFDFWSIDTNQAVLSQVSTLNLVAGLTDTSSTGPTIVFQDSFTDTNGIVLSAHAPDIGSSWSTPLGSAQINGSNQCRGIAGTYAVASSTSADCTLQVEMTPNANSNGLTLRYVDNSSTLYAVINSSTISIHSYNRPTDTLLGSAAVSLTGTVSVTAVLSGDSISVTAGGVTVTGSTSYNNTANRHGLLINDPNIVFDNFRISYP